MTNGEKIQEIFSNNVEIGADPYSPSVDIYVGGIMMMRIDRNWWNAEYKESTTKNGISNKSIIYGDDCISRQAVIDMAGLSEWFDSSDSYNEFVIALSELPSVTPQELRWIPVSERLPEKDMACLVAVGRFNFTQIAVYSDLMGIIDHRIFYQGDVGHNSFKNITQYVKAWMPLPKPYSEVKE